jgi:Arc/MetJ-type ribon-helix-helix transcriptional regulator
MAEPVKTTVRLTDKDQANIEKIIKTGIATNISEAIRVGLAVAPQFLGLWQALMSAKIDNIGDTLTQLQEDLRRERNEQPDDWSKTHISIEELRREAPKYAGAEWLEEMLEAHSKRMQRAQRAR